MCELWGSMILAVSQVIVWEIWKGSVCVFVGDDGGEVLGFRGVCVLT